MHVTSWSDTRLSLVLAVHCIDDQPYLVGLNWQAEPHTWAMAINVNKLTAHYLLDDINVRFIPANQLTSQHPEQQLLLDTIWQLQQYAAGERQYFSLPLDTSNGTAFEQQVWQQLQRIPYGRTISYKQLAEQIGSAKAYRAVGMANSKNPLSIVVPCHRVIASNGKLGGYTGGTDNKQWLLRLEGHL